MYDVAQSGHVVASFDTRNEADDYVSRHGGQIRVRSQKRTVPAVFAVFVDGAQVGDPHPDPGSAAKAAKAAGGQIRMVPAPST